MHHDQHGDWSVHRSLQQHKQEFLLTEGLMASSWRSPQAAGLISLSQVNHSASLSGGRFSSQQMHSSRTGGDRSKQGLCSRGGKGEPKQSPPCCTHGAHLFPTCLPAAPQVLLQQGLCCALMVSVGGQGWHSSGLGEVTSLEQQEQARV